MMETCDRCGFPTTSCKCLQNVTQVKLNDFYRWQWTTHYGTNGPFNPLPLEKPFSLTRDDRAFLKTLKIRPD